MVRSVSIGGPYPECECGGKFVPIRIEDHDNTTYIYWKCTNCGNEVGD